MSKKERPLPRPAKPAFGRKGRGEDSGEQPLMADEIARAAAEGRLDDFLSTEVPDNDYARSLVSMMMGMTGMTSTAKPPDIIEGPSFPLSSDAEEDAKQPPAEVVEAARKNDVEGLKKLLKREHNKRRPGGQIAEGQADTSPEPSIEKKIIEDLIKIASDNDVSLDWLTLRALRLYVQEYRKSGRL